LLTIELPPFITARKTVSTHNAWSKTIPSVRPSWVAEFYRRLVVKSIPQFWRCFIGTHTQQVRYWGYKAHDNKDLTFLFGSVLCPSFWATYLDLRAQCREPEKKSKTGRFGACSVQ